MKRPYISLALKTTGVCLAVFAIYGIASEYVSALEKDSHSGTDCSDSFASCKDIAVSDSFTISTEGMMTLCIGYDALVSSNVKVCDVMADSNEVEVRERRQNMISAGEGVLIQGKAGTTFYLKRCELKERYDSRNDLIGITADTILTNTDSLEYLAVNCGEEGPGFYKPHNALTDSTFTAKAHRAYLKIKKI